MKSLAEAFGVSVETMLERSGLLDEADDDERTPDTETAIRADRHLTDAQKEALLSVYRGFVGDD